HRPVRLGQRLRAHRGGVPRCRALPPGELPRRHHPRAVQPAQCEARRQEGEAIASPRPLRSGRECRADGAAPRRETAHRQAVQRAREPAAATDPPGRPGVRERTARGFVARRAGDSRGPGCERGARLTLADTAALAQRSEVPYIRAPMRRLVAGLVLLAVAACGPPITVSRVSPRTVTADLTRSVLNSSVLSVPTQNTLYR